MYNTRRTKKWKASASRYPIPKLYLNFQNNFRELVASTPTPSTVSLISSSLNWITNYRKISKWCPSKLICDPPYYTPSNLFLHSRPIFHLVNSSMITKCSKNHIRKIFRGIRFHVLLINSHYFWYSCLMNPKY